MSFFRRMRAARASAPAVTATKTASPGVPAPAAPAASNTPVIGPPNNLSKAINVMKTTGNYGAAADMLRKEVGLPSGPAKSTAIYSNAMDGGGGNVMKKGGAVKYAKGGVTRADGIATKGHTKGRIVTMKSKK
jgi:hypothetical protein